MDQELMTIRLSNQDQEPPLEELLAERNAERIAEKIAEKLAASEPQASLRWLTMKEAAAHVDIDYSSFSKAVRLGQIPSHLLLGRVRINQAELDEWALNQPRKYG
jgi:excisionase family DNA binding protein